MKESGGVLVSTDRPVLMRLGLLVGACVLLVSAARKYATLGHVDWFVISLVVVAAALLVSVLALPTTRFVFDPARKLITWTSGSLTVSDGGQCNFSDVSDVVLQITAGGDTLTYRVALRIGQRLVPLAVEYVGNRHAAADLARRIRSMLGMSPDAPLVDAFNAPSSS